MPKSKKETEVTVTDKEYLRNLPSFDDDLFARNGKNETPVLFLYQHSPTAYTPIGNAESFYYVVHGCEEGNGKPQKMVSKETTCKYCKKDIVCTGFGNMRFATKEYNQTSAPHYSRLPSIIKCRDTVIISQKEGEEDTTIIQLVSPSISYVKDKKEKGKYYIVKNVEIKTALEVIPGVSVKGYRILKRSIKEINAFEAMNINATTISYSWTRNFIYADASCLVEYLYKHKIFAERTGIKAALKNCLITGTNCSDEAYLILHLCMISDYPILEALLKMGYSKLYFDLVSSFRQSQSKIDILKKVNDYKRLFSNTTKGSTGLRIPNYIGDYLKGKGAPLKEYYIWCDIYELQPLSKEQFNKYIDSIEYSAILSGRALDIMPKIIKYGYTIEQATKYIFKQIIFLCKKTGKNIPAYSVAHEMSDYLMMCEFLDITPNKFPPNIKQSHDEIISLKHKSISPVDANKIKSIGESTQKLLNGFVDPANLTKMEEEYFIKVPTTEADFIEEGNLQNSCVGNYYKNVSNGNCIVFFIRKKDEPNLSYITAEYNCHTEKLGQCMYANNRIVEDEDLLNYCKVACSRIKTGILTSKIA